MTTPSISEKDVKKNWFVVDAENKVLGRLATKIAHVLTGKHKTTFVHYIDTGDYVVVINADKVRLTGKKWQNKQYFNHSGYPGGVRLQNPTQVKQKYPERLILHAVKGMLPNNKLRALRLKKLKVYTGTTHPHSAQKPETLDI